MRRVEYPGRSITKVFAGGVVGISIAHANQPAAARTATRMSQKSLLTMSIGSLDDMVSRFRRLAVGYDPRLTTWVLQRRGWPKIAPTSAIAGRDACSALLHPFLRGILQWLEMFCTRHET